MRGDAVALLVIAAGLVGGLWFYFRATREPPKHPPPTGDGDIGPGGGDP